ncbi:FkbM family methyltransferase [Legionella brunensis]|uniref:Methyltransferase FkbM domain-containing protein n=1 Tax=Legionella brunensis TaxID=29422 RepID=A0A0W0S0U9_9GAMM|nr:FkbM family methyltransferase [Legionella brunensis]KTC77084.1 hypothetical protein Lbru_3191 [Legionella brunensis]
MTITSYAQNFEDIMLWRALGHIEAGFYIDIGAQHPVRDSVSKAFYERGWRGVHIEPVPSYASLLRRDRPDEIVLETAITDASGSLPFYEIPETGLSTGSADIAYSHQTKGFSLKETRVPCITLATVFEMVPHREIHWLKIDVEGFEYQVLNSWGEVNVLPWIIVVESTLPLTQTATNHEWEHLLFARGYQEIYFDGLNRFYLSKEHPYLASTFHCAPTFLIALFSVKRLLFVSLYNKKSSNKQKK